MKPAQWILAFQPRQATTVGQLGYFAWAPEPIWHCRLLANHESRKLRLNDTYPMSRRVLVVRGHCVRMRSSLPISVTVVSGAKYCLAHLVKHVFFARL